MQFIGSYYIPNASTEAFKVVAKTALFEQHPPSDGFSVQAMLLYAMGLHIGTDFQAADQTMELVVKMALDLGMNRNSFAISTELWRRAGGELGGSSMSLMEYSPASVKAGFSFSSLW
jgi:hypothetical protein